MDKPMYFPAKNFMTTNSMIKRIKISDVKDYLKIHPDNECPDLWLTADNRELDDQQVIEKYGLDKTWTICMNVMSLLIRDLKKAQEELIDRINSKCREFITNYHIFRNINFELLNSCEIEEMLISHKLYSLDPKDLDKAADEYLETKKEDYIISDYLRETVCKEAEKKFHEKHYNSDTCIFFNGFVRGYVEGFIMEKTKLGTILSNRFDIDTIAANDADTILMIKLIKEAKARKVDVYNDEELTKFAESVYEKYST